jgi:chromosome partitioning protein
MATTIIAIGNQKGGVAKTTTCQSLGACLAEMGRDVLLIDLDPQAHLTMAMGINPEGLRHTVSDALLANASLVSVSRESVVPGLDIVPANQELALLDKFFYGRDGYEFYLKRRLGAMNPDLYDFILIDCAPSFGAITLNALTAADRLLIPIQCEYFAARSLRRSVELARMVREKTNPRLSYQILVTMYDRRNRICRFVLDQMRRELSHVLFETIIEVDTRLRESPAFGQPITLYAPNTRGSQQYRALARELTYNGRSTP